MESKKSIGLAGYQNNYWSSTSSLLVNILYIPLTNRVRGPYRNLRTEFSPFDLWPKREAHGPKIAGKKWGSVTYSTGHENEVSKILITSLLCVWRVWERFPLTRDGFKFLKQVKSKMNKFEIVFSLEHTLDLVHNLE